MLEENSVVIRSENGCSTNVVLQSFVKRNQKLFNLLKVDSGISHSEKRNVEELSENWVTTSVEIGHHKYNFKLQLVVGNCRYDIKLSARCHTHGNLSTNCYECLVKIGDTLLQTSSLLRPKLQVETLSVKKVQGLVKQKKMQTGEFTAFQVKNVSYKRPLPWTANKRNLQVEGSENKIRKEEFSMMFRD